MKKKKLYLIGAGGHAREALVIAHENEYEVIGFIEENPRTPLFGLPVQEPNALVNNRNRVYHTVIGDTYLRERLATQNQYTFVTLISKSATVGERIVMGEDVYIGMNVSLTADIKIGNHVLINTGAIVSHEVIIEDYVTISPGAVICGRVKICKHAFIGANATIIERVTIGEGAIVAAGAVVIRDVPKSKMVAGVPAIIKK